MIYSLLFAPGSLSGCIFRLAIQTHNDKLNAKLPEVVLLEIFDAYRQEIELHPRYEKIWNSRDGWFKLAHVCQNWRHVVLSSPSRLHTYLLFTEHRPLKEGMVRRLPRFPILVDYSGGWTTKMNENLARGVMRHRRRFQGIALQGCPAGLLQVLTRPFPELKSLKISPEDYILGVWAFLPLFSQVSPLVCDG